MPTESNSNEARVREAFEGVLGQSSAEGRRSYLDQVCDGDPQLRASVEALLRAHERATEFLARNAYGEEIDPNAVGTVIGPYRLLEQIGEGGFGLVYMAEQREPVRRKVALKIIKAGMDSKEVIARFEAERQALALMYHPHIAKVLDVGATETGRPYFVMELVKGIPITDYCDRHNLSMADRLQIFMQVCHAVQHAHQKAIIHRDLKPSNILVTLIDGEPMAMVIDFGVAKALGQTLTERTLFTGFLRMVGTPAYMSPEQAELSGMDIDTRTDIYTLGVLLYELLTGVTPLDAGTLRQAALDEIRRMIRETDAPKPSTRLHTLGERLDEVARHRHVEPAALSRLVQGDMDWIVMKCLEKDRSRRYETAEALVGDLQRHLEHQPVLAGPPSAAYRARKFIRRHRVGVGVTAAVSCALLTGLTAALIGFVQANRARELALAAEAKAREEAANATAAKEFLKQEFLRQASPNLTPDRDVTLRTLVDRAAQRIGSKFQDAPLVEADIRMTLSSVFLDLGDNTNARLHLDRALAIYSEHLPDEAPTLLRAQLWSANVLRMEGRELEGQSMLEELLPVNRRVFGPEHSETLAAKELLARFYGRLGDLAKATQLNEEVLSVSRRVLGSDHDDTLACMVSCAAAYGRQGKLAEAQQLFEEALAGHLRIHGPEHPATLTTMCNLGTVYHGRGRLAKAQEILEQVLFIQQRVLGPEHPSTLSTGSQLASVYRDGGGPKEAEELAEEIVSLRRRVLGPEHPATLRSIGGLAAVYHDQGKLAKAQELREQVLPIEQRILGPEHPSTLGSKHNLAVLYMDMGRLAEAQTLLEETLPVMNKVLGPECHKTLVAKGNLAEAYARQNKLAEAKELNDEVLAVELRVLGPEHPFTLDAMYNLACYYERQHMRDEQRKQFEDVLSIQRRVLGEEHPRTLLTMCGLARTYATEGKWDEAREYWEGAVTVQRRVLGTVHPDTAQTMNALAWMLATCPDPRVRDGQSAKRWAEEAVAATCRTNAGYLDNLAAAYAEAGEFEQAVDAQQEAIDLLDPKDGGRKGFESRLELYKSGIPYHDD